MTDRASPAVALGSTVRGETVAAEAVTAKASFEPGLAAWPLSPGGLRRRVLLQLRLDGPSSPDDLAARLGASRTGILQQLRALEAADVVTRTTERHGVGRPRHRYEITAAAQALFPDSYDGLAVGLLAAIDQVGGDGLVAEVIEARRRHQAGRVRARMAERLPREASIVDRVRELAAIQDEQGYLAEAVIGADGVIRLHERNCAIHRVASDFAGVCKAELELFEDVLDADVERECHIASGDRCCSYRIEARTQPS